MEAATSEIVRFELRLPLDLAVAVKRLALEQERSRNAQIVVMLRRQLQASGGTTVAEDSPSSG